MEINKDQGIDFQSQYNTQKKIQRPSDDPTIAARALKYRTTLAEIDQYLTNIKDATDNIFGKNHNILDLHHNISLHIYPMLFCITRN